MYVLITPLPPAQFPFYAYKCQSAIHKRIVSPKNGKFSIIFPFFHDTGWKFDLCGLYGFAFTYRLLIAMVLTKEL